jgi:hypothetical protein
VYQRVSVCLSLGSVTSGLLSIACRLRAIVGRPGPSLGRRCSIGKGAPAVFCRASTGGPGSVACRQLFVLERSRFVAGHCRYVAVVRHCIAGTGNVGAPLRSLLSLVGAVIAKHTRGVVRDAVSALSEIAIAGFLIGIGRVLVALGQSLVAVRPCLVGIRERLLAIGKRLIVERLWIGRVTLVFWLDLAVRGLYGEIA